MAARENATAGGVEMFIKCCLIVLTYSVNTKGGKRFGLPLTADGTPAPEEADTTEPDVTEPDAAKLTLPNLYGSAAC